MAEASTGRRWRIALAVLSVSGALAGYIGEVPIDPFSGKPLAYKRVSESFILYSWGQDLDDDGGTRSVWGRSPQGGDQVFWPVEERRK